MWIVTQALTFFGNLHRLQFLFFISVVEEFLIENLKIKRMEREKICWWKAEGEQCVQFKALFDDLIFYFLPMEVVMMLHVRSFYELLQLEIVWHQSKWNVVVLITPSCSNLSKPLYHYYRASPPFKLWLKNNWHFFPMKKYKLFISFFKNKIWVFIFYQGQSLMIIQLVVE